MLAAVEVRSSAKFCPDCPSSVVFDPAAEMPNVWANGVVVLARVLLDVVAEDRAAWLDDPEEAVDSACQPVTPLLCTGFDSGVITGIGAPPALCARAELTESKQSRPTVNPSNCSFLNPVDCGLWACDLCMNNYSSVGQCQGHASFSSHFFRAKGGA